MLSFSSAKIKLELPPKLQVSQQNCPAGCSRSNYIELLHPELLHEFWTAEDASTVIAGQ